MKKISLLSLTISLFVFLALSNVPAQEDYTRWHLPEGAIARYGKEWINDIAFSPDGEHFSVATTIGVWTYEVDTRDEVNLFTGEMSGANAIAYTPDGNTLAAAHWDRTVRLWDVNSSQPTTQWTESIHTFDRNLGPIYAVAISPDGTMVASGGADGPNRGNMEVGGLIRIWDLDTKEPGPVLPYSKPVSTIAFSPNSRWIAGGSGDGTIRVWDAGTGERIYEFTEDREPIWKVVFSPDSKLLLSISLDGTGRLRDLVPPHKEIAPLRQDGTAIYAASFTPNADLNNYTIVTGNADKRVRFWSIDVSRHDKFSPAGHSLDGHNDTVWTLALSKDGKNLASGSLDGTVRLWDVDLRIERFPIMGHTGSIKALAWTADNRIRACGTGLDGILRFWDAGTGGQLSTILEHAGLTEAVTFSRDGGILASGGDDASPILLSDVSQLLNNNSSRTLEGNRDGITALALSSTSQTLASGGKDAKIHLLDVETRSKITTLIGATSTITALTFSPDDIMLFSGEANGKVRVWDANTGIEKEHQSIDGPDCAITALALSTDKSLFAIGDEMGGIRLRKVVDGREIPIPTQHTRKITSLIFNKDEDTLVSGSEDGTILLWDVNEILSSGVSLSSNTSQNLMPTKKTLQQNPTSSPTPQQIAQTAQKSTVHLIAVDKDGDTLATGSGFFIRSGYIATNYHVIEGATWVYVKDIGSEKKYAIEKIAAVDIAHDLAILKAMKIQTPILQLADSNAVQTGETIYVVGNPKGLEGTFSKGVVSNIHSEWIQIDAPISRGSSGGPVLNEKGEVIGVATAGHRDPDAQNLNFVVPSNYLKALLRKVQ